jgi:transaldolase
MNAIADLAKTGTSIWLDDLSRPRLQPPLTDTSLETLIRTHGVVGVTTNPTIFAAALGGSDQYDEQLRELAARGVDVEDAVQEITCTDVRMACDLLHSIFVESDGKDGRVSIEVDPRLAHDTEKTLAEARTLWRVVDRPNLFVKVPATDAGLPAISQLIFEGISVNVTLIFSLSRYIEVMDAFIAGHQRRADARLPFTGIESVASFFISRMDSEIDKRLASDGSPAALALRGKAAIANARLAYRSYEERFSSEEWAPLEKEGARRQRPLWASTGVKDPSYRDTRYVEELTAENTVNTMPESTLRAVLDHGVIAPGLGSSQYEQAEADIKALSAFGIDYNEVIDLLESEGVTKFLDSWEQLLDGVRLALNSRR